MVFFGYYKISCILQLIKCYSIKKKQYNSSSRLISVAERLLSAHLQNNLIENNIELTVEQWRILFYLWKEDGINQQELAYRASKEKSTITRQIDVLEKKGLILRKSSNEDKRNKLIYVTTKGQSIENKALETAREITKKAETGISNEQMKVFKNVVTTIIKNLQD